MGKIFDSIRNLLGRGLMHSQEEAEELRKEFRGRYHRFKMLLAANNSALETMAEIEEALGGRRPVGMNFVRSCCVRVATDVYQMVRNMNDLAPGKYEKLFERFEAIRGEIDAILEQTPAAIEGPFILDVEEADRDSVDLIGGKLAALGEIRSRLGLRVPGGFAVTAAGYARFMEHADLQAEIDRLRQAADLTSPDAVYRLSSELQNLIISAPLPEELEQAMASSYAVQQEKYGQDVHLAVRSSAIGEDTFETSFAGQYRSELNVDGESLPHVYKEIVASKYSVPAMTYRLNRGIRDEDVAMCVGCLRMVDAVSGGVLYTANPVDIRDDSLRLSSVWGLPKPVVDGSEATDAFVIARDGEGLKLAEKTIAHKPQKYACYPDEGVCRLDSQDAEADAPSLTDDQALEIATTGLTLQKHYGHPLDVEWALEEDGVFSILQCRPLMQIAGGEQSILEDGEGETLLRGGVVASPGVGAGPVFVVRKEADALNFPEGGVMVAAQALPRLATLLGRASAVIAGQGSVASHLANVAREFGVPALFGVEDGIEKLPEGEDVTVDATGLAVHTGRIERLLEERPESRRLFKGTPVYETLEAVAQHITPLHLLDPDSTFFRPSNCTTFHDLTRFCHEKSVREMFQFGKAHHFPERSSKQLVCQVPMQWWVLNLEDGFKEEVDGKYVLLENIASVPMLALWDGIVAVHWAGPPAMDSAGMMSVMFRATTNRDLVPGLPSTYAERNYFMISKRFVSLQSRFGFHFSTVEALIGDRQRENYVSFNFKGGAADEERRKLRIRFVREILEEQGFQIRVNEDHLAARLENHPEEFMVSHLRVLGYLIMHTRQLDMIMLNSGRVAWYRSKFEKDIARIVAGEPLGEDDASDSSPSRES